MHEDVRRHYERHPYPRFPLLASVRRQDTYALSLTALWASCNGQLPPPTARQILLAGCGTFSPYPTSLANPDAAITALDLSPRSLGRARLHALLHGCRNIRYVTGDLADGSLVPGPFGFIDSYGVLHHLADPAAGLQALRSRLLPGGIIRLMVYSRGSRGEAEAIRRAFRLLGVRDVAAARQLIGRSPPDSRLTRFVRDFSEAAASAGLADAFLHPRARTYRVDEFLEMVTTAGLTPLRFAHQGALPEIEREVTRLRELERTRAATPNYILYAGLDPAGSCSPAGDAWLLLNPALTDAVAQCLFGNRTVAAKLGQPNPPLTRETRRLLRQFRQPQPVRALGPVLLERLQPFLAALYLVAFRGDPTTSRR